MTTYYSLNTCSSNKPLYHRLTSDPARQRVLDIIDTYLRQSNVDKINEWFAVHYGKPALIPKGMTCDLNYSMIKEMTQNDCLLFVLQFE